MKGNYSNPFGSSARGYRSTTVVYLSLLSKGIPPDLYKSAGGRRDGSRKKRRSMRMRGEGTAGEKRGEGE